MKVREYFASKFITAIITIAFLAVLATAQDLSDSNWRVFHINPNEAKLWDINQADLPTGVTFDFYSVSSGWYAVYLNTNFGRLTGKTSITATAHWTPSGEYKNRANSDVDAHFRLYFQSAQGNYNSNDYWWSTDSCDLNIEISCALTVSLETGRDHWTNLCGQSATDIVPHPGPNCVGGTDPNVSPFDGFTKAMRNVKDGGLSFGRAGRYASGVAIGDAETGGAAFHLDSYTINN